MAHPKPGDLLGDRSQSTVSIKDGQAFGTQVDQHHVAKVVVVNGHIGGIETELWSGVTLQPPAIHGLQPERTHDGTCRRS